MNQRAAAQLKPLGASQEGGMDSALAPPHRHYPEQPRQSTDRPVGFRNDPGALALILLCAIALAPGAWAQAEKPLKTKGSFVTTSDGIKIHYLEAGTRRSSERLATAPSSARPFAPVPDPAILFVPGFSGGDGERRPRPLLGPARPLQLAARRLPEVPRTAIQHAIGSEEL